MSEEKVNVYCLAENLASDIISAISKSISGKETPPPELVLAVFGATGAALSEFYDTLPAEDQELAKKMLLLSMTSDDADE